MEDFPVSATAPTSQFFGASDRRTRDFIALRDCFEICRKRRRTLAGIVAGFLLLGLSYCLVSPNNFEASARVALRMQPGSSLALDANQPFAPASILSTPLQLETMVDIFKSERLGWRVITATQLYDSPKFALNFSKRFPGFDPSNPTPEIQSYLLERFDKNLRVRTLPRTLLIQIDFRCHDPVLAARVVNAMLAEYAGLESQSRREATSLDADWLSVQLRDLTAQTEIKEQQLAEFERKHNFLTSQQSTQDGQRIDTLHDPSIQQVEEAGRLLAAASGDRILREALYREAQAGNPEQVLAANPELQAEMGPGGATLVQQLRSRSSEIGVELAQLKAEHGPNFPRVLELDRAITDIARQIAIEDANLLEGFRRSWTSAAGREQLLHRQMEDRMAEGLHQNDALLQYSVLHEQVVANRSLASRMETRIREATFAAGVHGPSITVVDSARVPFKPVSPNWMLSFAIALFVGIFAAVLGVFSVEMWHRYVAASMRAAALAIPVVLALYIASFQLFAQAPTPNTSGLPTGVVRLPSSVTPVTPSTNAADSPQIWNSIASPAGATSDSTLAHATVIPLNLPIAPGDIVQVSEFHVPEFRTTTRVAEDGTVLLPMLGQVKMLDLTEIQAARLIEKAFLDQGLLLHPHVSVMVTTAVGQDVSVMGEVARPGVYGYTPHHRLLDLISAASGLAPNAGRLVTVVHRDDPNTAHAVVLDPGGLDTKVEHNPNLSPGDTVLVSRAGLVYVIGDVVRPGGFAVDPVQGLTIVQALSLAWGATPNASVSKAILIRDQPGGRTLTTLNLRRMIRGQDPDQPVRDRDILFVPDSAAKNLLNRSLESAIQSAIGVTIYAGLVYSQRF